jgi:phage protein U
LGILNKQQIDLVSSKGRELELSEDAGKIARQVGFIVEGVAESRSRVDFE